MKSNYTKKSDEELVQLVVKKRSDAFEVIYQRHESGVTRMMVSFGGYNRDVIDDLVQEVFFRVIKGLKNYQSRGSFTKYLYTVALNVGRNYLRSNKSLALREFSFVEDAYPDPKCCDDWSRKMMEIRAFELVIKLPVQLQEVVALRISSDMKFRQIAKILNIPESSARRLMHEAMTILREKMGLFSEKKEIDNE